MFPAVRSVFSTLKSVTSTVVSRMPQDAMARFLLRARSKTSQFLAEVDSLGRLRTKRRRSLAAMFHERDPI